MSRLLNILRKYPFPHHSNTLPDIQLFHELLSFHFIGIKSMQRGNKKGQPQKSQARATRVTSHADRSTCHSTLPCTSALSPSGSVKSEIIWPSNTHVDISMGLTRV
ncbi:hypothetical protein E2C01_091525 [Portunus trituberculatus]|uniref:Uncharacterized protein n=1 Tax=Portunus trituberculatus TaxID=210409 RepID=A0A5B7JNU0_PORTR|nr:hypothetical protein [Portunus trituberculatus]